MEPITQKDLEKALEKQTAEISSQLTEVEDRLGQMIASGFADLENRVLPRVEKLERKVERIEDALHVTP